LSAFVDRFPSDESLGYFRSSLRDFPQVHVFRSRRCPSAQSSLTEFPLAAARFKELFGVRPPANAKQAGSAGVGGITDQEK